MSNQFGPTYPGGFSAIVQQMESRLDPLDYADGEGLMPLACDLGALQHQLIDANGADVPRSKSGYARKFRELAGEFHGQPALLHLHGLLIAHLRRRSQPAHTAALFLRLWAEHAPFLLAHLDCRWQVSAITTFGDHGASAVQRQLGQSLSVLFATMKLYETERLYSGLRPDQPHSFGRKSARHLPMGMDAYALKGGGLDVNLLGKLWQQAGQDRVIAPLAQSLLEQLIADPGGVFRRLRMMRAERAERKAQPPTTPPHSASPRTQPTTTSPGPAPLGHGKPGKRQPGPDRGFCRLSPESRRPQRASLSRCPQPRSGPVSGQKPCGPRHPMHARMVGNPEKTPPPHPPIAPVMGGHALLSQRPGGMAGPY